MRLHPSALYRFAQFLRVLAVLAMVILVLFLGTVAFSAAQLGVGIARQAGTLHHSISAALVGTSVLVNVTFPVANQGYYDVGGLTLVAIFSNQSIQLSPIAVTEGGPVTLPGHGKANLSLLTAFDMGQPAGPFLLLNDAGISGMLWLNASYATVIPVNLEVAFHYHWGAPFANLSYATGTPFPGPNSTVEIPVTIHFENHTPGLKLAGNLTVTVTQPNGIVCTQQKFPVQTHNGPVTLSETFIVPSTCTFSGDTITSVFTAPGINVALPTETIP